MGTHQGIKVGRASGPSPAGEAPWQGRGSSHLCLEEQGCWPQNADAQTPNLFCDLDREPHRPGPQGSHPSRGGVAKGTCRPCR